MPANRVAPIAQAISEWRVVVKLHFGLQALRRRRGAGEVCRFLYSRTTSPFNENRIATTSLISVWS